MNITRNEIRTGLLVVFALVVLTAAVLYLGAPGVFTPMNTYWVYVPNAAGLKPGNNVLLAGRKVGQVVELYSPVPENTRPIVNGKQDLSLETLIQLRVVRSAAIYKDVQVNLTSNGLLGEMLLDFTSGREWSGLVENGATFIGQRAPGLDQAVPMVLDRLDPALKKATETLDSLQNTADNLTKLTAEGGEVPTMLAEFRKFGTNLNDLTDDDGSLRLTLNNLQSLTGPEGKLSKAVSNFEGLTNDQSSLAQTLKNAQEFTAKLNNNKDINLTLQNFRQTSEKLNSTVGDLGKQFSAVGANLQQASDTVKRQPWRLIWPSTKKYADGEPNAEERSSRAPATPVRKVQRRRD